MKTLFKLMAVAACLQYAQADVTTIESAADIDTHVGKLAPGSTLVFQDLDRCVFYNRAGDQKAPDETQIYEDGHCITEAETDSQLRDPEFKDILSGLQVSGYRVMAVTGRPPAIDTTIAQWYIDQGKITKPTEYLDAHWKICDPLKEAYLETHDGQLADQAKAKVAAMEFVSGLIFSNQASLQGSFEKPNSGSAYYNGVAYTGYDKGNNILWYLKKLGFIADGTSTLTNIVVVDDDLRSIKSYQDVEDQFKALDIRLHYLHWAITKPSAF